jgi:GDP-4-dehydro-6-deoxy-D-mannose reductase
MNIFITGANGFAGSHLIDTLLENSNNLKIFGFKKPNARMRNVGHLINKINWIEGDLTDSLSVLKAIKQSEPDQIYHLGALSWVSPSWNMPSAYFNVNSIGTINLLEAVLNCEIDPKILVTGTPEEYGDVKKEDLPITEKSILKPVNPYAASKVAQNAVVESYIYSYDMKIVRSRAFNHEGPRRDIHGALASFAFQIANIELKNSERKIYVGNLEAKRNFTHVKDTVAAYIEVMNHGNPGEIYLIGNEKLYSIKECLELLLSLSSVKNIEIIEDPNRVRPSELNYLLGNYEKFRNISNWNPTFSLEEILIDSLNYWRGFIKENKY